MVSDESFRSRARCVNKSQNHAQVAGETRQFSVCARHVHSHHARVLEEASFEAAAVAYLEDFHPPMTEDH